MKDNEIRVGLSISASGRFQLQGEQALKGILLWQGYANCQGGIRIGNRSRFVRLIWYDDESQARRTRENVLRLIHDDHVDILLGPYSSNLTIAAAEIAEDHQKILWNYGGAADEIFSRGSRHLVGIASLASNYLRAFPPWLADEYPKVRRICVLHSAKGSFARQVGRGIQESAQESGHSVELVPFEAPFHNDDAALSVLVQTRAEAIVLAGSFLDELAIMQTRPCWPTTICAVAAVGAGIAGFASRLGRMAEGVLGPSQWEPGVSFPTTVGPTSDWFLNSFQKQVGAMPDYVAAGSFATGLIVSECIRQAASLDGETLRRVASQLNCNSLYGRFRIDPQSGKQLGHRVLLIRWQNGTKTLLST